MFCPRCNVDIDTASNECLCIVCGWYGDKSETVKTIPVGYVNSLLSLYLTMDAYQKLCRYELILEQLYDNGQVTEKDVKYATVSRIESLHLIMDMFYQIFKKLKELSGNST